MCTGDCEVGRTTHASADHYTVGPEDRKGTLQPLWLYSINCFIQCLLDVKVWPFDDSVHTWIVAWNANVMNVILLPKILQGLDELRSIIHYNLWSCSPSTQNILKHPFSESDSHFDTELPKFDIVQQWTTSLYDLFVPVQFWKVHGVNIDFGK